MSLSSLLGALLGIAMIGLSVLMSTDKYGMFFDVHGLMMVGGGTVAMSYMGYQAIYVNIAFKAIGWMFVKPKSSRESLNTEIMRLIKWSYLIQKKGLPALEGEIKAVPESDAIVGYCLSLVVSNHAPAELRTMMETAIESEFERRTVPVEILKNMAGACPAFGMVGTLLGLVAMLQEFGSDMSKIAVGMSLALITTLYGVVFARLIFLPAALKLQQKEEIDRFRNYMVIEGLLMLAEKKGPRYMQDKLNSFLDPSIHFNLDKQLK
jgi:chemotaxis protein MotA